MLDQLIDDPRAPMWGLGFHAQQAAEKAIKSVLTAHSIEYPRTHNLSLVMDLLCQARLGLPPDAAELARLTPFAGVLRYDDAPEAGQAGDVPDRSWLRDCVRRTLEWAGGMIG